MPPMEPWSKAVDFYYMDYDYMVEYLGWYTFSFGLYWFKDFCIYLMAAPMYNVQWQFRELVHYQKN